MVTIHSSVADMPQSLQGQLNDLSTEKNDKKHGGYCQRIESTSPSRPIEELLFALM